MYVFGQIYPKVLGFAVTANGYRRTATPKWHFLSMAMSSVEVETEAQEGRELPQTHSKEGSGVRTGTRGQSLFKPTKWVCPPKLSIVGSTNMRLLPSLWGLQLMPGDTHRRGTTQPHSVFVPHCFCNCRARGFCFFNPLMLFGNPPRQARTEP